MDPHPISITNMFTTSTSSQTFLQSPPNPSPLQMERKWKSNVEVAPNCPRCASPNTKFCYYNNYSLSQPRYFCKGCRRYWTKGGSLRNVPVGGGCRKYRRAKSVRVPAANYGKSLNGFNKCSNNGSILPNSSCDQQGEVVNGTDIDLAVVFAKFLNQDLSNYHEPKFINDQEFAINETQKQNSDLAHESNLLEEQGKMIARDQKEQEEERIEELMLESHDMDAFGLKTLLGDQMFQDALWSGDATFDPVMQWQELNSFLVEDHQLKISANNVISDSNWSSLDFSGLRCFQDDKTEV